MKKRKWPVLLAAALSVSVWPVRGAVPSAVAIKDAHVVTLAGPDLPKATVLLRNGLIEQVGESVTIPTDAWVIDGAGLTVYPGFIDGLSTWGIPAPLAGAANRTAAPAATAQPQTPEPRVRGPEDRPQNYSYERAADLVTPSDTRLEAARAAGYTSAATFPTRGIFEGLGALVDLAGDRGRDMVVAQPIGQQIVFRVGAGGFTRSFPGSLMGNIAYVRQLYLDLQQYNEAKQTYAAHPAGHRRPDYDHDLEGLAEAPRILLPADQVQQIERVSAFGKELKTPYVLYGMHEAFRCLDSVKQANVPVLISLKWPEKPKDGNPEDVPNYRDLVMREQAPQVPGMLVKSGVKFAFFSDGVESAADLKKAVKKAIDAGLSREDAVKALTSNVAQIYGVEDRVGTLEKGKIANLVVMKGDAFEPKTTVEYVFVDGREFEPSKELQNPSKPAGDATKTRPSEVSAQEVR